MTEAFNQFAAAIAAVLIATSSIVAVVNVPQADYAISATPMTELA